MSGPCFIRIASAVFAGGLALASGCTPPSPAAAQVDANEIAPAAAKASTPGGGGDPPATDASGQASTSREAGRPATRPFAFQDGDTGAPGPASCSLDGVALPPDARVFAAGAYAGRRANFQIDQSGHEATTMRVAVNHPDAPVALLLGAYEPTVWSVGWTPGTRIVAVVATGYHRQHVTGLPTGVPLLVSTHKDRGPCGYAYVGGDGMARLNPLAREVFGRPVDTAFAARDGQVLVGSALAGAQLETDAAAVPPDSFRLRDAPLAGQAGIDAALRAGILRAATPADVAAWHAANQRQRGPEDVPPVHGARTAGPPPVPHRAYTVLKAFRIPAGLYGAHSATFYIAPGVAQPTGNPGHSAVHDIASGTCRGATCGMR